MINKDDYITDGEFHDSKRNLIYNGKLSWAINKKNSGMAKVIYEPAHLNNDFQGKKQGHGKDFATWIFSEEEGKKENLFNNGLELLIDAYFEPDASVGLHSHNTTDEIYYIISGEMSMTTVGQNGEEVTETLYPGDAHVVKVGQSHFGTAGKEGCRTIVIGLRSGR